LFWVVLQRKADLLQAVFNDIKSHGAVMEALKVKAQQLASESTSARTQTACDQLLDKYYKAVDCAEVSWPAFNFCRRLNLPHATFSSS
jgi:hypothetical protein